MEYTRVTKENIDQEHICCAISKSGPPIKVDTPITGRTPHRTVREAFPHTALYKSDASPVIRRY